MIDYKKARCISEPRGNFGLGDYQRGESYQFYFDEKKRYYHIFPVQGDQYAERVHERHFKRFFTLEA
ncbi:hypothetical protein GO003_014775 [Methylicorpusculum oleiharenae]|uniref:hypothetical protein n=1 Tax=Methylicorpusculum oleiharenae TaxID=1338687 RepID=UPI00135CF001|nr:hypothetical protein [Methylicorpusculum oleiharenae]MCD2451657.1 hypothetical protein [Methylicorpusculum oleiharenae]